nr:hypothetical protein Iba_chr14aCG16500 [Ipomoea batatas]
MGFLCSSTTRILLMLARTVKIAVAFAGFLVQMSPSLALAGMELTPQSIVLAEDMLGVGHGDTKFKQKCTLEGSCSYG